MKYITVRRQQTRVPQPAAHTSSILASIVTVYQLNSLFFSLYSFIYDAFPNLQEIFMFEKRTLNHVWTF